MKRWLVALAVLTLAFLALWLLTTSDSRVWPIRNTLQYRAWERLGLPRPTPAAGTGALSGTVVNVQGEPVPGAWVLVPAWDGSTWSGQAAADGYFSISGIPAGNYHAIAGAPGYRDARLGGAWGGVWIDAAQETVDQVVLAPASPPVLPPPEGIEVGAPSSIHCEEPLVRDATRREVRFGSRGAPNPLTFLYEPVSATVESALPTLLAVYPGPVETWECVSVPLAAAGYAVLAVGPAYSLELERDIDGLAQLLALARAGALPGADGGRAAVLAGSYSALLVERLIERESEIDAAVLLGPPTDLFDIRRRYEAGTFVPPFKPLEDALIALGFPDEAPLRYWRYSALYHVRADMPPIALFHSRNDEVVPFEQSVLYAGALERAGVEHELHLFDAASHYLLSGDAEALEIYRLTLDFLARHLQ